MNKDQAKGKWRQLRGMAKKAWSELTDDDFEKAGGSVDKLLGVIQEKFGDTREAIEEKLDKLQAKLSKTKAAAEQRRYKRADSAPTVKPPRSGKCCG
jgi:uncharacterized protein YjbJ (UPF0337 family)